MTVHRPPTVRPHHRKTNVHSLSLGAQEKTNCILVLWSIDSCQNRASADQYHLTLPRAQGSTHRSRVFFEVIRWQITSFKWSQAQVYFFHWFISNMLYMCLCHYGPALLGFWFQTDLGRENSASFFLKYRRGRPYLTMVTRWSSSTSNFILWLVKIWQVSSCGKICSILKVVYSDSWSWQSFVSTCDVFNGPFLLDVQNEIQLLSRVFCYSWLVCLLRFWLRNVSLIKIR